MKIYSITPYTIGFLIATALQAFLLNCSADDVVIGRFGDVDYGDWKATGTAFQKGPASADLLTKLEIENAADHQVISSEIEADGPTGTLTSPEFKIARKYISFRIGGGDYEHDTCLNLLIDGKVVRSATGWRSDRLAPTSWDVSRWLGKSAQPSLSPLMRYQAENNLPLTNRWHEPVTLTPEGKNALIDPAGRLVRKRLGVLCARDCHCRRAQGDRQDSTQRRCLAEPGRRARVFGRRRG